MTTPDPTSIVRDRGHRLRDRLLAAQGAARAALSWVDNGLACVECGYADAADAHFEQAQERAKEARRELEGVGEDGA